MNNKDYRPSIPEELAFELNAIGIPASIVHVPRGTHDLIQSTVTNTRVDPFFTDEVQYEIVEVDVPWTTLAKAMRNFRQNALGVMADLRKNMEDYDFPEYQRRIHARDYLGHNQALDDISRNFGNLTEGFFKSYHHIYEMMVLGPQVEPLISPQGHQILEDLGQLTWFFTERTMIFFQSMLLFGGIFFISNIKSHLIDVYRERRDFRAQESHNPDIEMHSEIIRIQDIFMSLVDYFEYIKYDLDTRVQRNERRRERNRRQIAANQSGGACRRHRHRDPRVNKKSRKSYRL
jgi:hypothetical protein